MKKILTLALALMTGLSFAQPYNNTYNVNLNFDQLRPSFNIISNVNGLQESITVSDGHDFNTNSDYFILTRLAVTGNPVPCNLIVRAPNDPMEGYLYVEALHETMNGDLLVGGYYYASQSNMVLQPFLARFDRTNCTMLWHVIYPVNQRNIVNAATNKVSLCRVYNEPVERYLFVVAGDSDVNPGNEVATNVLKVDAATGGLIFSNKYYPTIPSQFPNLREWPGDIEYSPTQGMYMITGHREYTNSAGGVINNEMYHFGILANGAFFIGPNNFLAQTSKSIPLDQDMVFDATTGDFATVFTHEINGYVPGVQSVIGFVKVSPFLALNSPGLIWHNQGDRHNGRSISLSNLQPGAFALGAGTRDNQTFINNPAFQFVNNVGGPITPFKRYNIFDDVYFYHHTRNAVPDEFILASEQATDLRVISTDPTGDDFCGLINYDYKYQPYSPSPKLYRYTLRTNNKEMRYDMHWMDMTPPFRKCVGIPPVNSYRMAGATGISSFTADKLDIKVYPSVVSKNTAELTIENGSGVDMKVEVRNVTGQLIQTTENVGSGKTTVTLSQGLSAGVYMVHFYNADGNISATEKILISE